MSSGLQRVCGEDVKQVRYESVVLLNLETPIRI